MGVRGRVGHPAEYFGEEVGRPPGGGRRAGVGPAVQRLDQLPEPVRQFGGSVLAGEEQQGLDDGPMRWRGTGSGCRSPAVRGAAPVDQGVQRLVQVQVRALDPVGELLVGEAVAGAGGDEEALGEDGGGPAGAAASGRCGPQGNTASKEARSSSPCPGPRLRRAASWTWPETLAARRRTGGAAQAVLGGQAGRRCAGTSGRGRRRRPRGGRGGGCRGCPGGRGGPRGPRRGGGG